MVEIQSLLTRYIGVWNEPLLWGWWGRDDSLYLYRQNSYFASWVCVCAIAETQWI